MLLYFCLFRGQQIYCSAMRGLTVLKEKNGLKKKHFFCYRLGSGTGTALREVTFPVLRKKCGITSLDISNYAVIKADTGNI